MPAVLPTDRLSLGLQLPVQSKSTSFAQPWEADAGVEELSAVARAADEAGFAYVAVCDHVGVPTDLTPAMGTEWWDTVATLGWLAGITERTLLVSHVLVAAYRHPLVVAKAWSTLDALSGGRAVLGVGAGHVAAEFEVLGADFAARGRDLDEAIDAVRVAFADEVPSFAGRRWSFEGLGQRPRPVRPGGPPVWVGGSSPAAIRRAATRGDGWLPQGPLTPDLVAEARRLREGAGLDPMDFDIGALAGAVHVGDTPPEGVGPVLAGPPEKVAHVLGKLGAVGARQVQVRPVGRDVAEVVDQVHRLGAEVLPLLGAPG